MRGSRVCGVKPFLQAIREELGMSGEAFGDALGITRQRVHQLERLHNQYGIPIRLADRILAKWPKECAKLGLDFELLVRGRKDSA